MKFLCEQCKAKYQIADEKAAGKMVRMKCRKCGHLIEVRATGGDSGAPSAGAEQGEANAPFEAQSHRPSPPQKPVGLPPRPTAFTGTAAIQRGPARPEPPPSALAGAFKSSVQRDEEVSAPIDMSNLSPSDEWYVAINGVPVGPILVAEIRRKAALGAVTEESLAWQEGLDEWRPLRSFPDLAASVREAIGSGRSSLLPAPLEGRSSNPPPVRSTASTRPAASNPTSARGTPPPRPPSRTNVVPFVSRLATAEKLEQPHDDGSGAARVAPRTVAASVVPDPFLDAPDTAAGPQPLELSPLPAAAVARSSPISIAPPEAATKGPPWIAIAMVVAAVAFGVTAAMVIFTRPAPQPAVAIVQTPATVAAPPSVPPPVLPHANDPADMLAAPPPPGSPKGPAAVSGGARGNASGPAASSSSAGAGRSLDLHALTQNAPAVAPTDDLAGEGPKAPGQCFSEGQVQQVIGMHQTAIRRACWERNPTTKLTVNVSVTMTIGSDGSAQSVVTNGDDASVARCIENDVRGWRFPAMGCSQKTGFSLKFVRQ